MVIIVLNRSISLEDLKIIRILMLKLSCLLILTAVVSQPVTRMAGLYCTVLYCTVLTAVVWQPVTRMAGLRHCVRSNISRFLRAASRPSPQMLP